MEKSNNLFQWCYHNSHSASLYSHLHATPRQGLLSGLADCHFIFIWSWVREGTKAGDRLRGRDQNTLCQGSSAWCSTLYAYTKVSETQSQYFLLTTNQRAGPRLPVIGVPCTTTTLITISGWSWFTRITFTLLEIHFLPVPFSHLKNYWSKNQMLSTVQTESGRWSTGESYTFIGKTNQPTTKITHQTKHLPQPNPPKARNLCAPLTTQCFRQGRQLMPTSSVEDGDCTIREMQDQNSLYEFLMSFDLHHYSD